MQGEVAGQSGGLWVQVQGRCKPSGWAGPALIRHGPQNLFMSNQSLCSHAGRREEARWEAEGGCTARPRDGRTYSLTLVKGTVTHFGGHFYFTIVYTLGRFF